MIVGGGNSAGQAAVFFSDWADQVTMMVRGSALSSSMSTYLVDQIESITTVAVRYDASVDRVEGDTWLDRVVITDGDGSSTDVDGGALFICIGGEPRTEWAVGSLARDEAGYLVTGPGGADGASDTSWPLERDPLPLETTVPMIFAIGDVRSGSTKRVSTAIGEGAMVVRLLHDAVASAEAERTETGPAERPPEGDTP